MKGRTTRISVLLKGKIMDFVIKGHEFKYELEKVARLFMPFAKFKFCESRADNSKAYILTEREISEGDCRMTVEVSANSKKRTLCAAEKYSPEEVEKQSELKMALMLYEILCDMTGYTPPWGILTGIRPAKLFSRLKGKYGTDGAKENFTEIMRVSPKKADLCAECFESEEKIIARSEPDNFSLYVSVPFCPSRCRYCSFVSHSVESAQKLIPQYVEHLCEEIKLTAAAAKKAKLRLQTVYIGGGTPTTLSAEELRRVMAAINSEFDLSELLEFTVEAGRPDTVTREKLFAIKEGGATRISINPQTMNDEVLKKIGRRHTAKETVEAFCLARSLGFDNINMDLIAGLDGDTPESFRRSVDVLRELSPENITVHTLSLKRASTLNTENEFFDLSSGRAVSEMVDYAYNTLTDGGNYYPYYMYRQGKTVGNLENVGYAKKGREGLYNVYIMDETHSILACGASAVTKLKEPRGGNIERVFNYKYPYEYISRFEDIKERKRKTAEFYEKYPVPKNKTPG